MVMHRGILRKKQRELICRADHWYSKPEYLIIGMLNDFTVFRLYEQYCRVFLKKQFISHNYINSVYIASSISVCDHKKIHQLIHYVCLNTFLLHAICIILSIIMQTHQMKHCQCVSSRDYQTHNIGQQSYIAFVCEKFSQYAANLLTDIISYVTGSEKIQHFCIFHQN